MRKRPMIMASAAIALSTVALLAISIIGGSSSPQPMQAQTPDDKIGPPVPITEQGRYVPVPGSDHRPNVSSSEEQVADVAVKAAVARNQVKIGTPEVILSKRITLVELQKAGVIGNVNPQILPPDTPLMIVVMHGNFNMANSIVRSGDVPYIGYIFDLRDGGIMAELSSLNGALFKYLLNDPSLPDPVPTPTVPPGVQGKVATKS